MGHKIRQPMTASALALGGVPGKHVIGTVLLVLLVFAAWTSVGALLAAGVENRWVVAASGASCSLTMLVIALKCVERIGAMLAGHARHMETITRDHGKALRDQVYTLNWMVTSRGWGEECAKIDAKHFYDPGPTDTGPFTAVNGAG